MTLPFFIIGCGAKKADAARKAAELYQGQWFKGVLAYARTCAPDDRILILSAKHGLLPLDMPVVPYDVSIQTTDCKALTQTLVEQLPLRIEPFLYASDITLLAGERYAHVLSAAWMIARDMTPDFVRPLQGLGIGEQLHWLKEAMQEVAL